MSEKGSFFIGGSPCSGKSTVTKIITKESGIKGHHCDDFIDEHLNKADKVRYPTMYAMSKMTWEEMFMREPEYQAEEEFKYYEDAFPMFLEDITRYGTPFIAEGTGLLPWLLHRKNISPAHAVFIVPTHEFQLHHYVKRPYPKYLLKDCQDPQMAYERWMKRDMIFGDIVAKKAIELGYNVIRVGMGHSVNELRRKVLTYLKL